MKDDHQKIDGQAKLANITLADAVVSVSSAIENSNKAIENSNKNIASAIESSNRHIASAIHSSDKKIADALTSVAEVIDKDERSREKEVRMVFWLGVLLPIVTFLGVVLTVWSSYRMEANREKLQRNYEEAQLLQVQVEKDNKIIDKLNQALADIREFRKVQQRDFCKNYIYVANKKKFTKEYNEKLFNLIEVAFGIKRTFNQQIYEQVKDLTYRLDLEKNICAKDAISDEDLRLEGIKINSVIEQEIKKQEAEIVKLKSSL